MPESPGTFLTKLCLVAIGGSLSCPLPATGIDARPGKNPKRVLPLLLLQRRLGHLIQYHEPFQAIFRMLLGQQEQIGRLLPAPSQ